MRNKIVEQSITYKDVPYRHQGRGRTGIDCAGLPYCVAVDLNLIQPYDEPPYLRRTNKAELIERLRAAGLQQKRLSDLLPGDVLLFKQTVHACHLGIYLGRKQMIHAHRLRNKVVVETYSDFWVDHTVGCYSFPGVN